MDRIFLTLYAWCFVISPQTLNQTVYIDLLSEKIVPILKCKRIWRKSIIQQDGPKPHTSNFALKDLKTLFPRGLISYRTDYEWPANSLDISPLDFFFCGWLKNKVYSSLRARKIEELIEKSALHTTKCQTKWSIMQSILCPIAFKNVES